MAGVLKAELSKKQTELERHKTHRRTLKNGYCRAYTASTSPNLYSRKPYGKKAQIF